MDLAVYICPCIVLQKLFTGRTAAVQQVDQAIKTASPCVCQNSLTFTTVRYDLQVNTDMWRGASTYLFPFVKQAAILQGLRYGELPVEFKRLGLGHSSSTKVDNNWQWQLSRVRRWKMDRRAVSHVTLWSHPFIPHGTLGQHVRPSQRARMRGCTSYQRAS